MNAKMRVMAAVLAAATAFTTVPAYNGVTAEAETKTVKTTETGNSLNDRDSNGNRKLGMDGRNLTYTSVPRDKMTDRPIEIRRGQTIDLTKYVKKYSKKRLKKDRAKVTYLPVANSKNVVTPPLKVTKDGKVTALAPAKTAIFVNYYTKHNDKKEKKGYYWYKNWEYVEIVSCPDEDPHYALPGKWKEGKTYAGTPVDKVKTAAGEWDTSKWGDAAFYKRLFDYDLGYKLVEEMCGKGATEYYDVYIENKINDLMDDGDSFIALHGKEEASQGKYIALKLMDCAGGPRRNQLDDFDYILNMLGIDSVDDYMFERYIDNYRKDLVDDSDFVTVKNLESYKETAGQGSDAERFKRIAERICKETHYNDIGYTKVFYKIDGYYQTKCWGYAAMISMAANYCGIPAVVLESNPYKESVKEIDHATSMCFGLHSYNRIYIDGKWYNSDLTFMDAIDNESQTSATNAFIINGIYKVGRIDYNYMLGNTEQFQKFDKVTTGVFDGLRYPISDQDRAVASLPSYPHTTDTPFDVTTLGIAKNEPVPFTMDFFRQTSK